MTTTTMYCYSVDNESFKGKYSTVEEAKLACIIEQGLAAGAVYYVGEVVEYTPRQFVSVHNLEIMVREQAVFETKNAELVGTWPRISSGKYHELRELLGDFFDKNFPVDFSGVENAKSYIVGE